MDLPYYHGPLSKRDCETLLLKEGVDGNYLLRDSESMPGVLCLCVSWVASPSMHMLSVGLITRWKRNCSSLTLQPRRAQWEIARHCHEEMEGICLSKLLHLSFPPRADSVEQQKWGWWEDKASGHIGREQRGEKAAMQESSSPMEADLFSKENMEF